MNADPALRHQPHSQLLIALQRWNPQNRIPPSLNRQPGNLAIV